MYTKKDQINKSTANTCKRPGCKVKVNKSVYCSLHQPKNTARNKYNAVRQTYNGYNYDSKREAQEAYRLDQLIKSGEVLRWERQVKIPLRVNGLTVANYFIDFKVYKSDGSVEYVEVKGAETAVWRLKFKMAKALYPDWKFVVVK